MKSKIILLFFIISLNVFSQKTKIINSGIYKAIYSLEYIRDSTKTTFKKSEKMSLLIGKNLSLFESVNSKFNDSLANHHKKMISEDSSSSDIGMIFSDKRKTRLSYKIIKKKNQLMVFDKMYIDYYNYEEIVNFRWKITNETKIINSYLCQKAITTFSGRNYIAWFTKEIPIQEGPYKFNGLPGLIVKIHDVKNQYVFTLLSFNEFKKDIVLYENIGLVLLNNSVQKVSKKEYYKAITNFKENPVAYMINKTGLVIQEENKQQQRERIENRAKYFFKVNPIELIIE